MTAARKPALHLSLFLFNSGHHENAWRLPESRPEDRLDVRAIIAIAQTAERGLLDAVFAADFRGNLASWLEPCTLLSAVAAKTRRVGLVGTVDTTYNKPFHVARRLASLDFISKGRAAWNIVTSAASAAHNYDRPHPPHEERYAIADEFIEVVAKLWDSWEDGALRYDKSRGVRFDEAKIHEIHHQGPRFRVKGPLSIARPPQGRPVLVQSGSSDRGREQAARWAEVVFTAQSTLKEAQDFYRDIKSRLGRYGRSPGDLQITPGVCFILGGTESEARRREEQLYALIDERAAIAKLGERLNVDLSTHPLDQPLVLDRMRDAGEVDGVRSRHQLIVDFIRREHPTLREVIGGLATGRGHLRFVGTPQGLADLLEGWVAAGAADGFNLMPGVYSRDLEIFVDEVVPILQSRGSFRTEYSGSTLRDHFGLARPARRHQEVAVSA